MNSRVITNLRRSRVPMLGALVAVSGIAAADPTLLRTWGLPRHTALSPADRQRVQRLLRRVGFTEEEAAKVEAVKLQTAPSVLDGSSSKRAQDRVVFAKESMVGSRWRGGILMLPQYLCSDDPEAVLPSRGQGQDWRLDLGNEAVVRMPWEEVEDENAEAEQVQSIADSERRAAWMVDRRRIMWTPEEQDYSIATLASQVYLNTSVDLFKHLAAGVAAGAAFVAGLSVVDKTRFARFFLQPKVISVIPFASLWIAFFWSSAFLQRKVLRHVDNSLEPGSLWHGISQAYLEQEWNRRVLRPLTWWRRMSITSTGVNLLEGPPFGRLDALERLQEEREREVQVASQNLKNSQPAIEEAVRRVFTPELVSKLQKRQAKMRDRIAFHWRQTLADLIPLGGASNGNRVTIYRDGEDSFLDMWRHMRNARVRVWMETYIFEPDTIGLRTIEILEEAARNCQDVRLTYDAVGSQRLGGAEMVDLIAAGADVVAFNPILQWPPWSLKRFGFYRNHRKILLCDDVAFTGGRNVGDEYAAKSVGGSDWFSDTHMKIEGPAVQHLEDVYLNSLAETEHEKPVPAAVLTHRNPRRDAIHRDDENPGGVVHEDVWVQVLQSNVRRNKRHLQTAMRVVLKEARDNCFITTPYFMPPGRLKRSLVSAAARGVNVVLVTSGEACDAPLLRRAGRHVYKSLLEAGVKVYEYRGTPEHPQNVHSKIVTIDGIFSSIGSYNLDPLSDRHNLELTVCMLDPSVAQTLEEKVKDDLTKCAEIKLEDLEQENHLALAFNWGCYQFFRLLNIKFK